MLRRASSPRSDGEMSKAPKTVRVLQRDPKVARPLQQETTVRVLARSARASRAPTKILPSSTRVLPRSSAALSRQGGGNKIRDVLRVPHRSTAVDLEEDPDTSDAAVGDDDESSSESPDTAAGLRQIRAKRRKIMQTFCGLDRDGMSCKEGISFLEESAVQPKTVEIYTREYDGFQSKCPVKVDKQTDHAVQEKMVRYAHVLFKKGHHVAKAEKFGASFLHFHPEFGKHGRRRIPRFWKALRGFRRRAPTRSRKPRAWPEFAALVNWMILTGRYKMGVWVLTAWGGYLRPSDCMRLRLCDLVPPVPHISDRWCLNLNPEEEEQQSKTGVSDEAIIWDDHEVKWLTQVFQALRLDGEERSEIWDFSYPDLCRVWRRGVTALKLAHLVPYQIRHSAPSWERLHNRRSRSGVGKKGRWKSPASLDRYEKSAMVTQNYRRIPIVQRRYYEECAKQLESVVLRRQLPLVVPWAASSTI